MSERRQGGIRGRGGPPADTTDRSEPTGLDRVTRPDPTRPSGGDLRGKRALYSVDPDAHPTPAVIVRCPRCEVERPLAAREACRLLRPPFVADPLRGRVWTQCPTCERRVWLYARLGPGIPWPFRPWTARRAGSR